MWECEVLVSSIFASLEAHGVDAVVLLSARWLYCETMSFVPSYPWPNWNELNWTVNFQIGCWTWTVNFYWIELDFLNRNARMCELLLWNVVGLNFELLVEKHVKVIFFADENVKKWFWGFFARFHPDCWVRAPNLENEFRYVKFGIDEKRRWTGLEKVWFSWTEVIFKTVYNSIQFL